MHTHALGVIAAFAIVSGSTAANATTFTFYYNAMDFMAAQSGMKLVEDFEDATLIPGLSIMSDAGSIGGGLFNDRVVRGGEITMFKKNGMTSFGGIFDLTPGAFGQGLNLSVLLNDNTTLNVGEFSATNGFVGFTSSDVFKKVTISAGSFAGVAETYTLNDLKIGMVPEPGTWAMLISGFGLVGAAARRRRMVVSA